MANKTSNLFNKMDHWDSAGCLYLNHFCHKYCVKIFFTVISRLGDGIFWYALALTLPFIYGAEGVEAGLLLTVAGLICLLCYKQLKTRLVRERPFIKLPAIMQGCAPLDRYSFPSGHTMHAVCFMTIVLWYFPAMWPLVLTFTLLVALSRMILGLHYPSDVICGAILGAGVASLTLYFSPY